MTGFDEKSGGGLYWKEGEKNKHLRDETEYFMTRSKFQV
jgi:hypothetical protein